LVKRVPCRWRGPCRRDGLRAGRASRGEQEAAGEEIEVGPAIHLALQHFQAIDMALDRPIAPGHGDPSLNGVVVLVEPLGKVAQGLQRTAGRALEPRIELRRLPLADQSGKVLRQVNGLGDRGRLRVELGELLDLSCRAFRLTPQDEPGGAARCEGLARGFSHR
jgi:hypothetical protein